MPEDRCYMCAKLATSREHVPPRSLFPESRDIPGANLRRDLITVPSCDKHNTAKSHDDEFLMSAIGGGFGGNVVGFMHKLTKLSRAIERTKGLLVERVFKEKKDSVEFDTESVRHTITWGTPDAERLVRCFNSIAFGLHYSHFGKRFKGRVKPHLTFLIQNDPTPRNFAAFVSHRAEIELRDKPKHGANPDVFYFQVTDKDEHGLFLMRLFFYGRIKVHIAFEPKGASRPFDLGMQLMNDGFTTVIELEGKEYIMNDPQA